MSRPHRLLLLAAVAALASSLAWIVPTLRDAIRRQHAVERFRAKAEFDHQAQAWDLLRFRDPATGEIPLDAKADEARWLATLAPSGLRTLAAGSPVWTSRGPFTVGGRTRDLEFDVSNYQVLIAANVTGGIWRSEDAGLTWSPTLVPGQLHSAVSLAQDTRPGHTSVWYAGTGERIGSGLGIGNGIYKSTDGGRTWTSLPSTVGYPQFAYVNAVAIDPTNATQEEVYAATESGVYRSLNGGGFWTRVLPGQLGVWVEVATNGVVYAAVGRGDDGSAAKLYRSPDGTTWTPITPAGWPPLTNGVRIAASPTHPDQVHFFTEADYVTRLWKYTYISGNGSGAGGTWVDRSAQMVSYLGTHNGYCSALAIGPKGPDDVYVAGQIPSHWSASNGRFVSIGSPAPHPDTHAFAFIPSMPGVVYVASDGGIDRADDGLYRFRPMNRGYVTTQFYGVGIHPQAPSDAVLGGTQDNWNYYAAPGDSARVVLGFTHGGDGGFAAILPDGIHVLVSTAIGPVVRRNVVTGAERTMYPWDGGAISFINPFAVDPTAGWTMYYPTGGTIWRTPDVLADDPVWTRLPGTQLVPLAITAIGVSTRSPSHRIYYGNWNGLVARVDDALGASPLAVNVSPPGTALSYVSSISVDPDDGDRVLVTMSNYNVKSVFWSTNAGGTWSEVGGNLDATTGQIPGFQGPAVIGSAILARPNGERLYFAGTSAGLFSATSLDGPATVWRPEAATTIGNMEVNQIAVRESDGFVGVATHGAGLWSAFYPDPTVSVAVSPGGALQLGPGRPQPFRGATTIPFELPVAGRARVEVFDVAGRRVAVLADAELPAGRHAVRWSSGGAPPGQYQVRLTAAGRSRSVRLTLLR